jgi:hypothetical protein
MLYNKEGLELFIKYLDNNTNFIFTKLGDGELFCIRGDIGMNCDGHPYSTELSDLLYNFVVNIPKMKNLFLAKWGSTDDISEYRDALLKVLDITPNWVYYNIILPQIDNLDNILLYNFYKTIKLNKRRKIYICPERLNNSKLLLDIDIIINIPIVNSFTKYNILIDQLKAYVKSDDIILYSCGMMSKSIINELYQINENLTHIDIGSGLDSVILEYNTRDGQPKIEASKNYFKSLYDN